MINLTVFEQAVEQNVTFPAIGKQAGTWNLYDVYKKDDAVLEQLYATIESTIAPKRGGYLFQKAGSVTREVQIADLQLAVLKRIGEIRNAQRAYATQLTELRNKEQQLLELRDNIKQKELEGMGAQAIEAQLAEITKLRAALEA